MNTWIYRAIVRHAHTQRVLILVLAMSLVSVCGCARQQRLLRGRAAPTTGQLSEEELRGHLRVFADFFESTVKQAAVQLDREMSASKRVQTMTLLWRVRMISACHTVLDQESPIAAFIDGWVLSSRMSQYFRDGEGAAMFGEHQEIAVGAADRIEADMERIGKLFLEEENFAETRENVHAVARANPIQGVFAGTVIYATQVPEGRPNPFKRAFEVPMAPFRALGGVDRGAVAMGRMVDAAQDFTSVVQALPESARWQMLLLLLELDETEMVRSFLTNMSDISENTSKLTTVVEQLPEEVHAEISVLLDEIEAKQPALNAALAQAENTAARIESAVTQVGSAADTIGRSAQSLTETGRAWESAIKTVRETFPQIGQEKPSTAGDSPPFDINEYRSAADAVTNTASELRQLAVDLRGLIESQSLANHIVDLDTRINEAIRHSSAESRGLINHAVLCAAGLIVLVFVLAIVYRLIARSRA